ncbi:MAG TPA: hypothetical protein VNM90_27685, partial [Haliangium sp.]|nr:hypothetical protein [Haliangium sp.]
KDMEIRWNTLLLQQIGASREFADAMDAQLGAQARQLAGIDLLDGRFAILPADGELEIETKQLADRVVSAVAVDLVGPDATAEPAVLAWLSQQRPGQAVEPASCTDDTAIQFFWARFPIEEMKRYTRTQTHPSAAPVRFPVETSVFGWPDVILSLELRKADGDSQRRVEAALDGAIAAWNMASASKIHHRGPVQTSGERTVQVHLDFGSAGPEAMSRMAEALDSVFAAGEIVRCRFSNAPHTPE